MYIGVTPPCSYLGLHVRIITCITLLTRVGVFARLMTQTNRNINLLRRSIKYVLKNVLIKKRVYQYKFLKHINIIRHMSLK